MNEALVTKAIENFRQQLNAGFVYVKFAYENYAQEAANCENDFAVSFEDYFHDWAQSNWELLVERVVCDPNENLVIYGMGTDYEADGHSRVFFHKAQPTHEIAFVKIEQAIDWITGESIDLSNYEFDGFVATEGEWFEISPPFNYVLLSEKGIAGGSYHQVVVPLEQIKWLVNKI